MAHVTPIQAEQNIFPACRKLASQETRLQHLERLAFYRFPLPDSKRAFGDVGFRRGHQADTANVLSVRPKLHEG